MFDICCTIKRWIDLIITQVVIYYCFSICVFITDIGLFLNINILDLMIYGRNLIINFQNYLTILLNSQDLLLLYQFMIFNSDFIEILVSS